MLKALLIASVSFLLFLSLHCWEFHFHDIKAKARSVLRMFFIGGFVCILLYISTPVYVDPGLRIDGPGYRFSYWLYCSLSALIYCFLFLGYLEFYFTADRSITCRMLILIDESPKKKLSSAELLFHYPPTEILLERFHDLTYGGYLRRDTEGNYELTNRGHKTMALYRFVIDFLNLKPFRRTGNETVCGNKRLPTTFSEKEASKESHRV